MNRWKPTGGQALFGEMSSIVNGQNAKHKYYSFL